MKMLKRLTKGRLQRWIADHKSGERVGAIASPCGCPIARFIASTLPKGRMDCYGQYDVEYNVNVIPDYIRIEKYSNDGKVTEPLYAVPQWAEQFILGVDIGEGYKESTYINREEALQLLSTL